MHLPQIFLLAAQLSAVLALPAPTGSAIVLARGEKASAAGAAGAAGAGAAKTGEAAKAGGAGNATAGGEKKEEEEGNEVEVKGQFGSPIALAGGATRTDVLFPPGQNGVFEIEFLNNAGRTLTVTENKTPAAPPTGFVALEPVSYKVSLAEGGDGITLSQIDYILNAGSNVNIRNGQIGRLCTEVNAFVIDKNVGELEFEEEENELKLVVKNMNAEWGIFLPQAAAGGAGAGAGSGSGAAEGITAAPATGAGGAGSGSVLDVLRQLLGLGAAA